MNPPSGDQNHPALLWFRRDLRLTDNPALYEAARRGPVLAVFILDDEAEGKWKPGAASRWWLHRSLASLERRLAERGVRLIVKAGETEKVLQDLFRKTGADALYFNRVYDPALVRRDEALAAELRRQGVAVFASNGGLLREPWDIKNNSGGPYRVFTPFWRRYLSLESPERAPAEPGAMSGYAAELDSCPLEALGLEPRIAWDAGLRESWAPGEPGARERLEKFLTQIDDYEHARDIPSSAGTSMLSPHLHFGELGVREVWERVHRLKRSAKPGAMRSREIFLKELVWREFSHHLLYHFPETPDEPLYPAFKAFPWDRDPEALRAWQKGVTGYPIVDAGMRELWKTGWMHNRVRMIAASFLVKDLLLPWQEGEAWFWDTLVDADLAQNTMNWQWTAGCGADAAPFFRIFNPVTQSRKFDPEGLYLRKWIPELGRLPSRWIHEPWAAPGAVLEEAGVIPGKTYPHPIVDHTGARKKALLVYKRLSKP